MAGQRKDQEEKCGQGYKEGSESAASLLHSSVPLPGPAELQGNGLITWGSGAPAEATCVREGQKKGFLGSPHPETSYGRNAGPHRQGTTLSALFTSTPTSPSFSFMYVY
jgi:hypothetical protein